MPRHNFACCVYACRLYVNMCKVVVLFIIHLLAYLPLSFVGGTYLCCINSCSSAAVANEFFSGTFAWFYFNRLLNNW
jgi:hypothetical protein